MNDLEQMLAGVLNVDAAKLRDAMRAPVVEPTAQELADYHADMAAGHGDFGPMTDADFEAMAREMGGGLDPHADVAAFVAML
jgi:hypothetical protein